MIGWEKANLSSFFNVWKRVRSYFNHVIHEYSLWKLEQLIHYSWFLRESFKLHRLNVRAMFLKNSQISVVWFSNNRNKYSYWCEVYKWNNSYLNCGCRWKWRMIIAVNLLRWSFFTFKYSYWCKVWVIAHELILALIGLSTSRQGFYETNKGSNDNKTMANK